MNSRENKTRSRQVDKKSSMQVRIDIGYHLLVKIEAARSKRTIKELVEEGIALVLDLYKNED